MISVIKAFISSENGTSYQQGENITEFEYKGLTIDEQFRFCRRENNKQLEDDIPEYRED